MTRHRVSFELLTSCRLHTFSVIASVTRYSSFMCLPPWVHYEALNKSFPCIFFGILHATVWHPLGDQLSKCCRDERYTHFLFSGNVCWAFPTGLKLSRCEAETAVGSRPLNVHLPTATLSWVLPLVLQMWIGFLTIWFKLLHVSCYSWELLIAQGCLLLFTCHAGLPGCSMEPGTWQELIRCLEHKGQS